MRSHSAPFLLRELKLEVTHECHLRCIHCSSLADTECSRKMTWPDYARILDEAAAIEVKEIAISGGEPLCWEYLPAAIVQAISNNFNLTLYTSGIANNALSIFDELRRSGLRRVIFSVFGSSAGLHEAITLTDGSFRKTIVAVQRCVELGFDTEFHFVPMSMNHMELRPVTELARNMGVNRVSVLRLVPQGRGAGQESLKLTNRENKALRQTIIDLRI